MVGALHGGVYFALSLEDSILVHQGFYNNPIDEGRRMAALFRETRGYHNDADPFKDERYSD